LPIFDFVHNASTPFSKLALILSLNHTQFALAPFSQLSAAVIRYKTNQSVVYAI